MWKNKRTILGVGIAILLLALIRTFETELFYDPFLDFFKGTFQNAVLPSYDTGNLLGSLSLRYGLNTILSLIIIYLFFKDRGLVWFSGILFLFFYVGLLTAFIVLLKSSDKPDYMTLFYIRRFLIQPLLLILFLPAFYYQKKKS
ncbi:exosortase F system-associated protein [Flavobacterium cerinum]|uniref:Exosortase F system-associated protein n=1 Tax=Flavobacterium cerinum TaxID=2502784 RepID=A0ABY5IWL0_9FLAO|nr:exosortase F system-associated protein [Flavobacterium cerinum]UUC45739.1 exosortase F system-associated protein [Flavobacterium cerinum]